MNFTLLISSAALLISILTFARTERRYGDLEAAVISAEVGETFNEPSGAGVRVTLTWLKGSYEAHDVHVMVRIQHRLFHCQAPAMGPGKPHAAINAVPDGVPDRGHNLGLADRPFLMAEEPAPPARDSSVVVAWRDHRSRRHWAGNRIEPNGGRWNAYGEMMRGSVRGGLSNYFRIPWTKKATRTSLDGLRFGVDDRGQNSRDDV